MPSTISREMEAQGEKGSCHHLLLHSCRTDYPSLIGINTPACMHACLLPLLRTNRVLPSAQMDTQRATGLSILADFPNSSIPHETETTVVGNHRVCGVVLC